MSVEKNLLNAMKEYWAYLAEYFDEPVKAFRKIKKAKNFNDYEEAVSNTFDHCKWIGSAKQQG